MRKSLSLATAAFAALLPLQAHAGYIARHLVRQMMMPHRSHYSSHGGGSSAIGISGIAQTNDKTTNPACLLKGSELYGVADLKSVLSLALRAEAATDQGTDTKRLDPSELYAIRQFAATAAASYQNGFYDEPQLQLAPHEALILCAISEKLIGKSIVKLQSIPSQ